MSIDPVLHEQIGRQYPLNGPEDLPAVDPLRKMHRAVPTIRYLYTVVHDRARTHFGIDAADPTAKTPGGQAEQSRVWNTHD